jgi:hypothetical protein
MCYGTRPNFEFLLHSGFHFPTHSNDFMLLALGLRCLFQETGIYDLNVFVEGHCLTEILNLNFLYSLSRFSDLDKRNPSLALQQLLLMNLGIQLLAAPNFMI